MLNGVVEVEDVYCDDCGMVGCQGDGGCASISGCCIDTKGAIKHEMVKYVSEGIYYSMCSKCGEVGGDSTDAEVLNGIGCCNVDGVTVHQFPQIKFKGRVYNKRLCVKCGTAKNLFRCKKGCVVCDVGDSSTLGLNCTRLRTCRRQLRDRGGMGLSGNSAIKAIENWEGSFIGGRSVAVSESDCVGEDTTTGGVC